MATTAYKRTELTGGTVSALDYIDGNDLLEDDFAFVLNGGNLYTYQYTDYDTSQVGNEVIPDLIVPDTNPGTFAWQLQQNPVDTSIVEGLLDDHEADTTNPHSVTATQVGLGSVASDLSDHEADTTNPHAVTKAQVGLGNVLNYSDFLRTSGDTMDAALYFSNSSNYLTWDTDDLILRSNDKGIKTLVTGSGENVHLISYTGEVILQRGSNAVYDTNPYISIDDNGVELGCSSYHHISLTHVNSTTAYFTPNSNNTIYLGMVDAAYRKAYLVDTVHTSDERLKNISDIGDCSWMYNLTPVSYHWKEDDTGLRFGFSAQDVYEKMPDKTCNIVDKPEKEESKWYMNDSHLIAPMLKLIQEQKQMIDDLTARLDKAGL